MNAHTLRPPYINTQREGAFYVVRGSMELEPLVGYPRAAASFEITCAPGFPPFVSVHGDGLTLDEEFSLHTTIGQLIARLRIPCACGLPWDEHSPDAPHAANLGDCRSFTAASPVAPERKEDA